jgi:hypothetical protein
MHRPGSVETISDQPDFFDLSCYALAGATGAAEIAGEVFSASVPVLIIAAIGGAAVGIRTGLNGSK